MSDNDDIPFNRDFALKPGVADEVRPGVRRVLCNNPSPFTFTGTVSYIVGEGNVATFARGARILIDGGYKIEGVTPVDQFRHTPHVELVARFRR